MENKKETLEDALEKYGKEVGIGNMSYLKCAELGAKWQAERMYNEEDMREAYNQGKNSINPYYGRTFENFLDMLKLKNQ